MKDRNLQPRTQAFKSDAQFLTKRCLILLAVVWSTSVVAQQRNSLFSTSNSALAVVA